MCRRVNTRNVPTYVGRRGRLMVYVSAVTYLLLKRYCYLLPMPNLCAIFVYSRDVPRRTNMRTAKYHSVENKVSFCGIGRHYPRMYYCNTAVSCTEALWKLHEICAEFLRNSSDFVKFLVTSTVYTIM